MPHILTINAGSSSVRIGRDARRVPLMQCFVNLDAKELQSLHLKQRLQDKLVEHK